MGAVISRREASLIEDAASNELPYNRRLHTNLAFAKMRKASPPKLSDVTRELRAALLSQSAEWIIRQYRGKHQGL